MLDLLLAICTLAAIIVLIALIWTLGLWMKGIGSVALPGLDILVGTQLAFFVSCLAEVMLILIAAYLVRFLPFIRELTDMMENV